MHDNYEIQPVTYRDSEKSAINVDEVSEPRVCILHPYYRGIGRPRSRRKGCICQEVYEQAPEGEE